MIHYHGTPITPMEQIERMRGRHFCISHAYPQDLKRCLKIGSSLMFDNGAFSVFTKGHVFDEKAYYDWLSPNLGHPHWAVIPDVIDGSERQQRDMLRRWPFRMELGAPVWHLGLSLDYLCELAYTWPRICLGSTAEYWEVGSPKWCDRMDQAFNALAQRRIQLPWIHGLRMAGMAGERWPLASVDSTNVAQNFKRDTGCAECKAREIDAVQCPINWIDHPTQARLQL